MGIRRDWGGDGDGDGDGMGMGMGMGMGGEWRGIYCTYCTYT